MPQLRLRATRQTFKNRKKKTPSAPTQDPAISRQYPNLAKFFPSKRWCYPAPQKEFVWYKEPWERAFGQCMKIPSPPNPGEAGVGISSTARAHTLLTLGLCFGQRLPWLKQKVFQVFLLWNKRGLTKWLLVQVDWNSRQRSWMCVIPVDANQPLLGLTCWGMWTLIRKPVNSLSSSCTRENLHNVINQCRVCMCALNHWVVSNSLRPHGPFLKRKKMWYIYRAEYYLAIKRRKFCNF